MGAPDDLIVCNLCGGRPYAVVAARWSFEVQRDAPSQNVLATNSGKSRWSYKKERDAWARLGHELEFFRQSR